MLVRPAATSALCCLLCVALRSWRRKAAREINRQPRSRNKKKDGSGDGSSCARAACRLVREGYRWGRWRRGNRSDDRGAPSTSEQRKRGQKGLVRTCLDDFSQPLAFLFFPFLYRPKHPAMSDSNMPHGLARYRRNGQAAMEGGEFGGQVPGYDGVILALPPERPPRHAQPHEDARTSRSCAKTLIPRREDGRLEFFSTASSTIPERLEAAQERRKQEFEGRSGRAPASDSRICCYRRSKEWTFDGRGPLV